MLLKTPEIKENTQTLPKELSRRERVMALRAKLNPISEEDADRIDEVILEAREASIPRDLPA